MHYIVNASSSFPPHAYLEIWNLCYNHTMAASRSRRKRRAKPRAERKRAAITVVNTNELLHLIIKHMERGERPTLRRVSKAWDLVVTDVGYQLDLLHFDSPDGDGRIIGNYYNRSSHFYPLAQLPSKKKFIWTRYGAEEFVQAHPIFHMSSSVQLCTHETFADATGLHRCYDIVVYIDSNALCGHLLKQGGLENQFITSPPLSKMTLRLWPEGPSHLSASDIQLHAPQGIRIKHLFDAYNGLDLQGENYKLGVGLVLSFAMFHNCRKEMVW